MRALYFDGKRLEEKKIRRPSPGKGEALIRVSLAGICSTDLEIMKGYMGFTGVPGHEFVGTVEKAEKRGLVGARVAGSINIPCGDCDTCRSGLGKHCPGREVLGISGRNGAFAEFLVLPAGNLHHIPDTISDEEAVFVELLAAACEFPERVRIRRGDRIAVIGDGRLGALCGLILQPKAGELFCLGIDPGKMSTLRGTGLNTIDLGKVQPPPSSFDIAVECTGRPEGLTLATGLVRPRGTVVMKSTYQGKGGWNQSKAVVDEITLVGSRCGPFEKAIDLLAKKKIDVLPFLTAVYPFEQWKKGFRRVKSRDSFKVALKF